MIFVHSANAIVSANAAPVVWLNEEENFLVK